MSETRLWLPAKKTLVSLKHESRRRLERDYRHVADHVVGIRPVGDWLDRLVWEIEHATLAVAFVRSASKTGGEFDSEIRQAFDGTGVDYLSVGVGAAPPANNVTAITLTYTSATFTQLAASTLGGSNRARAWLYKGMGAATGTNDLVFTRTGSLSMDRIIVTCVGYSGVDGTTPTGTAVAANGDSGAPSVTVTSVNSGELVVDVVASAGTGTLTVGAGQTQRTNQANAVPNGSAATSEESSTGSVVMSWTLSAGDEWGACGVALKPSGGGGGTFGRLVGGTLTGGLLVGGILTG